PPTQKHKHESHEATEDLREGLSGFVFGIERKFERFGCNAGSLKLRNEVQQPTDYGHHYDSDDEKKSEAVVLVILQVTQIVFQPGVHRAASI
ncbi:MAG: hypothetical protein HOL05_08485, partial [Nitrospinaceae bacterium]|nr:hypothetical protein [Nitrospinaceae bacterium]